MSNGQLVRLVDRDRPELTVHVNGEPWTVQSGDTVMTVLLTRSMHLGKGEFGQPHRSGFCLMGACQGCWVEIDDGRRTRACGHLVEEGMHIRTVQDGD